MTDKDLDILYNQIGQNIKELRLKKGYSQEEFADMLDLTRASIANIEGGRQRPYVHLLYDICKITEVDLIELLPPVVKGEETLLPKWRKKIEETAKGNTQIEKKLSDFLETISKEKK
jgi:transcriptional regulator with XRE-family HTH domain